MIYVDVLLPWNAHGHRNWCHLLADTEEELHKFAKKIRLKRKWFHPRNKHSHYDLTLNKRKLAVKYGAKDMNFRETLKYVSERK